MSYIAMRILMLGLVLGAAACTPIQPWERDQLAKPHMQNNDHRLQRTARTHIQNSREAATGGDVAAGGGCGCY